MILAPKGALARLCTNVPGTRAVLKTERKNTMTISDCLREKESQFRVDEMEDGN